MLKSLHDMFCLQAQTKAIALEFEGLDKVPRYIQSDEGKLRQILINLISNAIKFTHQGSVRVRIGCCPSIGSEEAEGEFRALTLTVTVEDSGDGVAPDELDKIFEIFTQTSTGRQSAEGTGLGLAISRQFAQLMGGDISITSEVNRGTTAHVEVQVTEVAAELETELHDAKVIGLAPGQPPYRILIVEDRSENRQLLEQYMEMVGVQVSTAKNGQEAIERWKNWEPDFIWMDWKMPVMGGEDATRKIRQLEDKTQKKTIIVALSASVLEETIAETIYAGCDDFVYKPFRESQLFDKLAQYLGVRYVYESSLRSPLLEEDGGLRLTQAEIGQQMGELSEEMLSQLMQSATLLEEEELRVQIAEISIKQPELAKQLDQLLQQLRLDRIAELAQTAMLQSGLK